MVGLDLVEDVDELGGVDGVAGRVEDPWVDAVLQKLGDGVGLGCRHGL